VRRPGLYDRLEQRRRVCGFDLRRGNRFDQMRMDTHSQQLKSAGGMPTLWLTMFLLTEGVEKPECAEELYGINQGNNYRRVSTR
jgi:hypothetical protein